MLAPTTVSLASLALGAEPSIATLAGKDDAPAAVQAAMANVAGWGCLLVSVD